VAFYVPDNGGCSQATAWMLHLIGSSTGPRAFPPFFLSSWKGGRRRGAQDAAGPPRRPSRNRGKKRTSPPSPSPCRSNRYTHTMQRLRTCTRASDRTCIRECSKLSLRFIIGSRPDITRARALLIGRRGANRPTPQIPIHPRKNCIERCGRQDASIGSRSSRAKLVFS